METEALQNARDQIHLAAMELGLHYNAAAKLDKLVFSLLDLKALGETYTGLSSDEVHAMREERRRKQNG